MGPYPETMAFWDPIYDEFFADANSRWELKDRTEEEDTITTLAPETEPTTPEPDSASTTVGYTFVILSLFGVLSKIHSILILS